ncbi:MAG: TPM domain-containing protein [Flavobacterium sp.]|nr:MAG: TPM domain-containing protein [Flavobacterium sp.]
MADPTNFLSPDEEREVVEAIRLAEKETSGEIRVHIERSSEKDAFDRAKEVFHLLKMDTTALKNGVLIYLAVDNRTFAICGDKGIDDVVEADFWKSTKDLMATHFRNGDFKIGLMAGIKMAGEQLQQYFPSLEDDRDELDNEISNG